MKWHVEDDDYFMLHIHKDRAQQQLAAFAIHLSMGNNVYCKRIKAGAIQGYINDVARIAAVYRGVDLRKDSPLDAVMGTDLRAVITELKRYDDIPTQREAFTPEMLKYMLTLVPKEPTDSLVAAIVDWCTAGLFAGLRCSEYAQTETHRKHPDNPAQNFRSQTKAFCLNDIRVQDARGRHYKGSRILEVDITSMRSMWIKFRTQKNGKHGAERLFRSKAGSVTKANCVHAFYNIVKRFVRLRGPDDYTTPLSVYRSASGQTRLITADEISAHMRAAACAVYKLKPGRDDSDINRWSSHSLRVGACVFLHSHGFSALDIKWILRWDSDAYLTYLRNFSGLADRQTEAFRALDDPTANVAVPTIAGF